MMRDRILLIVLRGCVGISASIIFLVLWQMCYESSTAFSEIPASRFFGDESWNPTANRYQLTPMLIGSLAVVALSLLITAPLGVGCAIFLHGYARGIFAWVFRRVLDILAGIPSVVYGLWGLTVLVPAVSQISGTGQGQSLLAGALVLSMMTLPIVAVTADAALGAVDPSQLRAGAALGFGKRALIWKVMLPLARRGLMTGIVLQVARAIGETMAVLMVCGNVVQLPGSIFAPVRTLTANIALEMGYADGMHRSTLFVSGLLLLLVVTILIVLNSTLWKEREASA